eukprot:TRINITY_DN1223_c0_g1_i1.p1 TRINITY_DN1223_c0_g1~~TRINITY_DN1223_c0_g1_i1.p1  ORF type:complete len:251 (-),score=40.17 TRINITY_DN1223_c0_g1_i1:101-853(-)
MFDVQCIYGTERKEDCHRSTSRRPSNTEPVVDQKRRVSRNMMMRVGLLILVACSFVAAFKNLPHTGDIHGSDADKAPVYRPDGPIITPFHYPLFKQCNSSWGNDIMQTTTICEVGCLMSSVSMALNGKKIAIDQQAADPATLNKWLIKNGGYGGGNDLEEDVVPKINPARVQWIGPYIPTNKLSPNEIKGMLKNETTIVIANVLHGHHFVLVTGHDSGNSNFYVNDPGFDTEFYTYDTIVGWRIFQMELK